MTTLENNLKATLYDIAHFKSVEASNSFTGFYKGFKRFPPRYDSEKDIIELYFDIHGEIESYASMSLAAVLSNHDIQIGEYLKVTKVSKKGNQDTWLVERILV